MSLPLLSRARQYHSFASSIVLVTGLQRGSGSPPGIRQSGPRSVPSSAGQSELLYPPHGLLPPPVPPARLFARDHASDVKWHDSDKVSDCGPDYCDRVADPLGKPGGPILVCVPTPPKMDGVADTGTVGDVLAEMNDEVASLHKQPVLVAESTVPPGTAEKFNKKDKFGQRVALFESFGAVGASQRCKNTAERGHRARNPVFLPKRASHLPNRSPNGGAWWGIRQPAPVLPRGAGVPTRFTVTWALR